MEDVFVTKEDMKMQAFASVVLTLQLERLMRKQQSSYWFSVNK